MSQKNKLFIAPPFVVESTLKTLGANLRTARVRRGLTIRQTAEKIGTGVRSVSDAEKGKITTSIGVYIALLWVFGLVGQLDSVASPTNDEEGLALALLKEPERVRQVNKGEMDNDF